MKIREYKNIPGPGVERRTVKVKYDAIQGVTELFPPPLVPLEHFLSSQSSAAL